MTDFQVGDRVEKWTGDSIFVGTVVSVLTKQDGKVRYVVQIADGTTCKGLLMVASGSQLRRQERKDVVDA